MKFTLILLLLSGALCGQNYNSVNGPAEDPARSSYIKDTFECGLTTTGVAGCLGWVVVNAGFVTLPASVVGSPGQIALLTSGTTGNTGAIVVHGSLDQDASEFFSQRWKIVSITGTNPTINDTVRFGLFNSPSVLNPPTGGMYLEKCGSATLGCAAADTDWFCVANTASTPTRTDTGVAFSGSAVAFQIRRIDSTHIGCKVASTLGGLPGATEVTVTGGEPTGGVVAGATISNTASEAKIMAINYFDQLITGLSR